jgi:putative ABC transport system permease protein
MFGVADDFRFAARVFRRSPGFCAVVAATLGTGIAAATLVFSLVNAVLYRIYDRYPRPQELVLLLEENPRLGSGSLTSAPAIAEWQRSAQSFAELGGLAALRTTMTGLGEPRSAFRLAVTTDTLTMLGARTEAGRLFAPSEYRAGAPPVVLLGHRLCHQFGGGPAMVGQSIALDGHPHTVVGVLGASFTVLPFFGNEPDLVTPLAPAATASRAERTLLAVGRLRRGVTLGQAEAEMKVLSSAAARSDPAARDWQVTVKAARGLDLKGDAGFIVVLGAGVAFILLIASANVANLLLSRSSGRTREFATRLALGATRLRLVRQLMAETTLLAASGGAVAFLLAYWGCRAASWLMAGTNLALLDLSPDLRTALFAASASAASAVAVGLVPAVRAARMPVVDGLREGRPSIGMASPEGLRRLLVGMEVALAVALLVGSGLVLQGLAAMRQNDPGFQPGHLSVVSVSLAGDRYARPQAKSDYVNDALARIGRPGGPAVAVSSFLPAVGGELTREAIEIEGRAATGDIRPSAGVMSVSPAYFATMGIPLKAGRLFAGSDRENSLPVAIVDDKTVEKWFGGRVPIDARIKVFGEVRIVVGVVGNVRAFHLNVAPAPVLYLPYAQRPSQSLALIIRTSADPTSAVALVRRELAALDRDQVIRGGGSYPALIARSLGGFDMSMALVTLLAAVALALAGVGLYSVMSFWVARRTRETAIRIALGASPQRVVREIVGIGLRLTAGGGIVGFLLALAVGKLLSLRMQQVRAFDPVVLGGTLLLVLTVAALACYLPARRAAGTEPMTAIRAE